MAEQEGMAFRPFAWHSELLLALMVHESFWSAHGREGREGRQDVVGLIDCMASACSIW